MKRSASLIILVAGTLFASCSSLQTISFDQLQAADVSFPDAVSIKFVFRYTKGG